MKTYTVWLNGIFAGNKRVSHDGVTRQFQSDAGLFAVSEIALGMATGTGAVSVDVTDAAGNDVYHGFAWGGF